MFKQQQNKDTTNEKVMAINKYKKAIENITEEQFNILYDLLFSPQKDNQRVKKKKTSKIKGFQKKIDEPYIGDNT